MAKGGDPINGLWIGTAVFSALKAKTFAGFIKSYFWYALLILAVVMLAAWILRKSGLITEKFSVSEIQCKAGETPTNNCNGERGCSMPSGNCYKLLSQPTAPPA
jgi:hypothetical protein